jgi:hypothetical protein
METRPQSFEEFWPYYVSQHRNKTNRRLHFIGTTLAMGCVAASPFVPAAQIGAPLAGYGFAWVGHFRFEKNKPASWLGPKEVLWSLRGDLRMWGKMLTGQMDAEVERLEDMHGDETDAVAKSYAAG